MDRSGDGVPALSLSLFAAGAVDLHLHSTASDGALPPPEVVARAASLGLRAVALTDHDTLDGLPPASQAGEQLGVRVVSGCEFSVAAAWGEMHLLGYFLPVGWEPLEQFLSRCRGDRERRGDEMVRRLNRLGVALTVDEVLLEAQGGAIGRPHVARALVRTGLVRTIQDAFDRYIGWNRPAFVEKRLPTFSEVVDLVHAGGGVVSAAHLKDRATRGTLTALKTQGLDAIETRHPTHDAEQRARLTDLALELGLLRTGGSDWHGDDPGLSPGGQLGGQEVPGEWLDALEAARPVPREPLPQTAN
jgi:predicted metal-dependent phosphoesterase TrpH